MKYHINANENHSDNIYENQMDLYLPDVLLLRVIWNQSLILFTVLQSHLLRKQNLKIWRFGWHLTHIHGPVISIQYRVMLCILLLYDKARKNPTGSQRGSVMTLTVSCNHHSLKSVNLRFDFVEDHSKACRMPSPKEDSNVSWTINIMRGCVRRVIITAFQHPMVMRLGLG